MRALNIIENTVSVHEIIDISKTIAAAAATEQKEVMNIQKRYSQ